MQVSDADLEAFRQVERRCGDHGYAIASLSELQERPDHEEQLAALLAEVYTATHSINPPRPMVLQGWIDLLRDDPPDPGATFLALRGKRYVALSAAHRDGSDPLTISWTGVSAGYRQHERNLMVALTVRQIDHAASLGEAFLQGEFDSTNSWAMLQLAAFPFRPAPCWLTFQTKK